MDPSGDSCDVVGARRPQRGAAIPSRRQFPGRCTRCRLDAIRGTALPLHLSILGIKVGSACRSPCDAGCVPNRSTLVARLVCNSRGQVRRLLYCRRITLRGGNGTVADGGPCRGATFPHDNAGKLNLILSAITPRWCRLLCAVGGVPSAASSGYLRCGREGRRGIRATASGWKRLCRSCGRWIRLRRSCLGAC
jgi:hypothetical protein